MSTACGRPQGGSGSCGQSKEVKNVELLVNVING